MTLTAVKKTGVSVIAMMALLSIAVVGVSPADAAVDNDQGTVSYYTYSVNFAFQGTDAASIIWDFGFNNEDGTRATSTEWNPQGIVFPEKGTYVVTQVVSNTVGSYTSQLKIEILGTPEVTFQTFGGSEVPLQVVKVGQTVEKPADPVKEGFVFAGWYTDTAFTNAYNFSSPVENHFTLYAKWSVATPVDDGSGKGDEGEDGKDDDGKDDDGKDKDGDEDDRQTFLFGYGGIVAGLLGIGLIGAYLRSPADRRNPLVGALGAVCLAIAGAEYIFGIDVLGMLFGGNSNE